jgi:hypothetical protein
LPTQAIPLALVSSLYPFGLVALLVLFGATRPRPRSGVFLLGAALCLLAVGLVFVLVARGTGLSDSSNSDPRYGLRIGFGVLFLIGAWILAHRPPKPKTASDEPSRVSKAVAGSGLLAVFVIGLVMYTPSPTYIAALDVVGGTKMSTAAAVGWVVLVVVLVLITIEVPILLYFVAPGWTVPKLEAVNQWLDRNGRSLIVWVLVVLGVWQIIDGIVGLV